MTDDSKNVDMDNLDEFENVFFNREKPIEAEVAEEDDVQEDEEIDETEDDTLETEQEDEASEDEDQDEDDEPEPEPKSKKKNSAQERIDELTADKYELRRELDAVREELKKLQTRSTEVEKPEPTLREQLSAEAPNPDAKDDKGEPLYPLGEFDPKFIRDLTKFTVEQETKAAREALKQEAEQARREAEVRELEVQWNEKLDEAEKEIPEVRDSIQNLVTVFQGIEPGYGDYLAQTLMNLENGPQVMHYLSQNIGEAQKIVASGPAAATLAFGRLDARVSQPKEEKRNKRVSEAPQPAPIRIRGQGGKFEVSDDTDDLDAFERKFFQKPVHPFGQR